MISSKSFCLTNISALIWFQPSSLISTSLFSTYAQNYLGAYAGLKSKFLCIFRVQLWAESIFPIPKVVMVYYFFPPKWLLRFVTNSIIHLIVPYFLDFHVLHCKFDLQFDPTMLYSHSILEKWVRRGHPNMVRVWGGIYEPALSAPSQCLIVGIELECEFDKILFPVSKVLSISFCRAAKSILRFWKASLASSTFSLELSIHEDICSSWSSAPPNHLRLLWRLIFMTF